MALNWKESEKGRAKGSGFAINEALLRDIVSAVSKSKKGGVETSMEAFLKEIGYAGGAAPSTVTYLLNKHLENIDAPIACGYKLSGKIIRFYPVDWAVVNKARADRAAKAAKKAEQ